MGHAQAVFPDQLDSLEVLHCDDLRAVAVLSGCVHGHVHGVMHRDCRVHWV